MLKSFLILDLPMNSSDEQIRKKYLKLIKENRPENAPEQFRKIQAAYEAVKDRRSRIKTKLFAAFTNSEIDETLQTVAQSIKFSKKQTKLTNLIAAVTNK